MDPLSLVPQGCQGIDAHGATRGQIADSWMLRDQRFSVIGSVVQNDELCANERLINETVNRQGDPLRPVVRWHKAGNVHGKGFEIAVSSGDKFIFAFASSGCELSNQKLVTD